MHDKLHKLTVRWLTTAAVAFLGALTLAGVAIWTGDGRYAAIGALVFVVALVAGVAAAVYASPETRRRAYEREIKRDQKEH